MTADTSPSLRFRHFEIRPAERLLKIEGEPMVLGSRAFDLLLALAERHGQLVTKQELLDLVWPGLVVEEHNIATQVGTLRKLLGAGAIVTTAGRGYRLTAERDPSPAMEAQTSAGGARARHNLPDPRTRFIGREAALADLARLWQTTRCLNLIGVGGCGKTRLALQFAQQRLACSADEVWFVDLAPLTESSRVASACAAVLNVVDDGDAPLVKRIADHIGGRQITLLLDNCEHVIAGVVTLVEALLTGSRGVAIVATSREAFGVEGEQIFPVRSLSVPLTSDLGAVAEAEAVRVFVDRARLVRPEFDVDADNAGPIADICRRLDGIALAIELAAARVTMLSVDEIAARLDDRFRLLTGGSRALPRHQTLQAAMQWSYEQLTPREQRVLRQIAVFAAGCTLRAAAEVTQLGDEYEALEILTALHDKSLLVVGRGSGSAGPRYLTLETVRQYALERLGESGEMAAARGRHVAHYVAFAEEAAPHLRGPHQDDWIARLRREHENLVVALTWCCDASIDVQMGLRLATATAYYWVWNSIELGHRLTLAILERDAVAADTLARCGAERALSKSSLMRGRYDEALRFAEQATATARRLASPHALGWALDDEGAALGTLGRLEQSRRCFEEGVDLARQLGDPIMLITLLNNLAETKRSAGELAGAERGYREALDIARTRSGRLPRVSLLNNLLRVQVARGLPESAMQFAVECMPEVRHEKIGVDLLEASVGLASCLGDHEQAARFWGAANRTLHDWGYRHQPLDVAHTRQFLEASRHALGDPRFDVARSSGHELTFEEAMHELAQWLRRTDADRQQRSEPLPPGTDFHS
ncbi:MAG: winged helix-turn-helix domain-containing protein [Casimicrobiaceae bacterium]